MEEDESVIKQNVLNRSILFQLILTAIIISLGTNLIVNSLYNLNEIINIVFLIIGLLIVVISSFILIYNNFKKFNRSLEFEAFIIYDSKTNKLIDVVDYPLSHDFLFNLDAAFQEDKAIKTIWEKAPLKKIFASPFEKIDNNKMSAREIIIELFEYIVLDKLSVTLTDFYNEEIFDLKNLEKYERSDIPDILLHNRFLNLFSKPMRERGAFIEDAFSENEKTGRTIEADGPKGELFRLFELVLPKHSKIKKLGRNKLILESDKIKLEFNIIFDGCGAILPSDFEELYLGLNFDPRYESYRAVLELSIKFKAKSLFTLSGWKYYEWIDKYISYLREEISMEHFLKSINWRQNRALLHAMNYKNRRSTKK